MAQLTARHIARHGLPKKTDVAVTSPYTGRQRFIVAAEECGSHVMLTVEDGSSLFVDATQKVDKVKRIAVK